MEDEALARLVGYDGVRYWLANGWSVRFSIRGVEPSDARPQGIRYAFNLHDASGRRLLGFDNAHPVGRGRPNDHSHRFRDLAELRPYVFHGADGLITDFFESVERACAREGQPFALIDISTATETDDETD